MNILKYFALPVGWFVGTVTVIAVGFAPDPYLEYVRQIPPPHPYPTSTVLWILLFMSIHVAVAFAILRPMSYYYSWGRALFALLLSFGFLVLAALAAMHAPPALTMYLWWLLAFVLLTLGLFIWSGICSVRRRFATNNSFNPDAPRPVD